MTEITKRTEVITRLESGDLYSLSLNGSGYNRGLTIGTRDAVTIGIHISTEDDLKRLLVMLAKAMSELDLTADYPYATVTTNQTLPDITVLEAIKATLTESA